MLALVIRALAGLALVFGAACGGGAATSTPSPGPASTATPTATPSPIALPASARVAPSGSGVVWMLVADSRLFRSRDRGETWEERPLPAAHIPIADIAFVSDREGWILATGSPTTQCGSEAFAVYRTADGGVTWDRTYASAVTSDAMCKDAMTFVDGLHGFVVASAPYSSSVILRTADGGGTWTRSERLPDPPGFVSSGAGYVLRASAVRAFGPVLLLGAVAGGAGNGKTYAFTSTDGGATWTHVATAPENVVFVTPTRWLQVTTPNDSRETTDGGATWHPFPTDYGQAAPIAPQIVFGDTRTGYATVRGGLSRTTDGGSHWTTLRTPGT